MYRELPEYIFIFIQATDFAFIFSFLWDCATCFDVDLDVFNFFDILFANSENFAQLFYFQNVLIFLNL